jgi:FTR1 family protein
VFNLSVFLIAFRDFSESFFLIGVLLGFSKRNSLGKEKSIITGGAIGLLISIIIATSIYFVLPFVNIRFPQNLADLIGHMFLIISGVILIFITKRLHPKIFENKNNQLSKMLEFKDYDSLSYYLLPFLLVFQEGIEITLFTSSSFYLSSPLINFLSLMLGFLSAVLLSLVVYKTYLKNHIKKLAKLTEILLIIYGFFLITSGIIELLEG